MANIPDVNFNKIPNKSAKFNQAEYYEANFDKVNEQIVPKINELDTKVNTDIPAQLAEKANKVQEPWNTPTLLNGVKNATVDISNTPKYFKDTLGIVRFTGLLEITTSGVIGFVLPPAYRPLNNCRFALIDRILGLSQIIILTNGNVTIYGSTVAERYIDISGVNYRAV